MKAELEPQIRQRSHVGRPQSRVGRVGAGALEQRLRKRVAVGRPQPHDGLGRRQNGAASPAAHPGGGGRVARQQRVIEPQAAVERAIEPLPPWRSCLFERRAAEEEGRRHTGDSQSCRCLVDVRAQVIVERYGHRHAPAAAARPDGLLQPRRRHDPIPSREQSDLRREDVGIQCRVETKRRVARRLPNAVVDHRGAGAAGRAARGQLESARRERA